MGKLDAALGKTIATQRTFVGKSQEALAHECNLHRTYISQLERGLKSPTVRVVFILAKALGVKPSELIRRVEVAA